VLLFELGAAGVEQRDATTLVRSQSGPVTLVASFERSDRAQAALARLPPGWSGRTGEIVGDAWRDEWKKYFQPFRLCAGDARGGTPSIVVRPPWRLYEAGDAERVIVLEPGRAFGTGLHETTQSMAELMAKRAATFRDARVLDAGCGSGILTLVALTLGARSVLGVDNDPDCLAVTRENAERNGAAHLVSTADSFDGVPVGTFPVIVANIEAGVLIELAPALLKCLAQGGTLLVGGILAPAADGMQWERVRASYAPLRLEETTCKGEWLAAGLRS
jgi:ribosomal protein L11 methyltransferase